MYDESLTAAEVLKRWRGDVGEDEDEDEVEESDDETFFKKSGREQGDEKVEDRAIPILDYDALEKKWNVEDNVEALRQRFATADLLREKNTDQSGSDGSESEDSNDEGDGEFQDLEAEEDHKEDDIKAEREKNARRKEELKLRFEEEDREGFNNDKAKARREGAEDEEFGEDDWYDAQKAQIQTQLNINKAEFELLDDSQRVNVEGFRAGMYAKIVIEGVASEFVTKFNHECRSLLEGCQLRKIDLVSYKLGSSDIDGTKRFSRPTILSSFHLAGGDSKPCPFIAYRTLEFAIECSSTRPSICIVLRHSSGPSLHLTPASHATNPSPPRTPTSELLLLEQY